VGTDVVDNLTFEVRDLEIPTFAMDVVLDTGELVKLDGTVTRLN